MDFAYQWWKMSDGGSPLMLGNTQTLTINKVKNEHEGTYYCIVTNEWGRTAMSNNLDLIVQGNVAIAVF